MNFWARVEENCAGIEDLVLSSMNFCLRIEDFCPGIEQFCGGIEDFCPGIEDVELKSMNFLRSDRGFLCCTRGCTDQVFEFLSSNSGLFCWYT